MSHCGIRTSDCVRAVGVGDPKICVLGWISRDICASEQWSCYFTPYLCTDNNSKCTIYVNNLNPAKAKQALRALCLVKTNTWDFRKHSPSNWGVVTQTRLRVLLSVKWKGGWGKVLSKQICASQRNRRVVCVCVCLRIVVPGSPFNALTARRTCNDC